MSECKMCRVSRREPCPICGKHDWCLVAADGSAAICARIEDGSKKRCGEAGWLHILRDDGLRPKPKRTQRPISIPTPPAKDFAALAKRYEKAPTPEGLAALAAELNVSAKSLSRLGVGWNGAGHTFPMRDEAGQTIGVRIRYTSGFKAAEKGSSNGLFIPQDLPPEGLLLVCEGPTDTAAALDLGLAAVGRPSCNTGALLLAKLTRGRDLVIVGDSDAPGRRGAERLASVLVLGCRSVRIVFPPEGLKDLRAWKAAGVTPEQLRTAIEKMWPLNVKVEARMRKRKDKSHGRRRSES